MAELVGEAKRCRACLRGIGTQLSEDLHRCRRCRSLFRVGSGSSSEQEALHDVLYFEQGSSEHMTPGPVLKQYVEYVFDHPARSGNRILDVGCGVAETGRIVEGLGGTYIGVETSRTAREQMHQRGFDVRRSLGDLPSGLMFDVALMLEVVEHLERPRALLEDVRERLGENGLLFVTTPNAGSLRARLERRGWREAANPTHVCLFTRRALAEALADSGFRPVAWQRRVVHHDRGSIVRLGHLVMQLAGIDGGLRVLAERTADRR